MTSTMALSVFGASHRRHRRYAPCPLSERKIEAADPDDVARRAYDARRARTPRETPTTNGAAPANHVTRAGLTTRKPPAEPNR